jgi:hypothetical protein
MDPPGTALPDDCLTVRLPAGVLVTRVHWTSNDPIWFGPEPGGFPGSRFDAPSGEFRTLYAAEELDGAFAETVLRKAARIIAWPVVVKRSWSVLELQRDLELAQLHGDGLAAHGVTSDICAGDNYGPSQTLSLGFYGRGLDGIVYRSRHNNDQLCYALFDRVAQSDLRLVQTHAFGDMPEVADKLIQSVKAAWDPNVAVPELDKLA